MTHPKRLTLFSTPALQKAPDEAILPAYLRKTGTRIYCTFGPNNLLKRIDAGSRRDIMIGVTRQLAALGQAGVIDPVTRPLIAKAGIGIAIHRNHEAPDISTVPALVQTLTNARSVAYSRNGASSVYFARLLDEHCRRIGSKGAI